MAVVKVLALQKYKHSMTTPMTTFSVIVDIYDYSRKLGVAVIMDESFI